LTLLERQLDLVAWPYGAEITLNYALDHPDRLRSLTLIVPPACWVLRAKQPLDDDTKRVVSSLEVLRGDISELQLEQFAKTVGLLQPSQSGRKPVLIIAGVFFFLSAFWCAIPESFTALILARALGGLGVGMASVLAPMYISEVSPPPRVRGRVLALYQVSIGTGILAAHH